MQIEMIEDLELDPFIEGKQILPLFDPDIEDPLQAFEEPDFLNASD